MTKTTGVLCLLAALGVTAQASAQTCDRACLTAHLNTYLEAVSDNDPAAGNLWLGFRQTENAIAVPEGQGLWETMTGLGSIQRRYIDPVQSAAGYFGTIMLGDEEAVVALRLKVEWDQVTEAEWFVAREGDIGMTGPPSRTPFNIETLRETLPAQRVVPDSERVQREALPAIVNTYFDGITSHNGYLVKGHPGCTRYENGFPTFNQPMGPGNDVGHEGRVDCRTQADYGVAIVAARNYYIVDEVAQVVMMSAVFRRDSGNEKLRLHFTEVFHIDDAKIRDVHAAFYYAPEDRPVPNWPPYDGVYPLPASYH
jgi:hypothetical protein